MDQPWTFERADLAPLPYFEEDDPFLNTAGPQPNHDFQAPFNPFFNAWDSPAADTIRSNNFSAQQLPVSNSPQAPFPINDGMSTNNNPRGAIMLVASNNIEGPPLKSASNNNNNNNNNVEDAWDAYWGHIIRQNPQLADHLQSDSGAQEAVTMTDNNKVDTAHTSRSKAKQVKVRATCESCRKLKIKCFPTRDGSSCEKCEKKGEPCVRKPRAKYPSRTKKS